MPLIKPRQKNGLLGRLLTAWKEATAPGSSDALGQEELALLVTTVLAFPVDVPRPDQPAMVSKALSSLPPKGDYEAAFLVSLNAEYTTYRKQAEKPFLWVSKVSLRLTAPKYSLYYRGSRVQVCHRLPPVFAKERTALTPGAFSKPLDHPGFSWIIVSIKARTAHGAAHLANGLADELRGMWNFSHNRRTLQSLTIGKLNPINTIRLGAMKTIHLTTGKPASDAVWLDYQAMLSDKIRAVSGSPASFRGDEKKITRLLRSIPFADELRTVFRRYAIALDTTDFHATYLKLYSLLERITAIDPANYDQLIRRTAFVWDDTSITKLHLDVARAQRNAIAHEAEELDEHDARKLSYIVKRNVEAVLAVLLGRGRDYPSLQAFGQRFLDLPPDPTLLRERRADATRGLRFRK